MSNGAKLNMSWKRLLGLALVVGCFMLLAGVPDALAAAGGKRIALVIGNSRYPTAPLANPVNDARLLSKTLRGVGFEVMEKLDLTQRQMKRSISEFSRKLEEAGKESVALFFYAGHGIEVNGRNFLIPIDAEINSEPDVSIEGVEANSVLVAMDYARSRLNFVILDACRNNPYARSFRSARSGLARMNAPRGTLIAYATAPGQVAADGTTGNSPYTTALVKSIVKPGLQVEQMFRGVRVEVMAQTGDKQTPWEASSLTGAFYFTPGAAANQQAQEQNAAPATTPQPSAEMVFWQSIRGNNDPALFRAYLAKYPQGEFALIAKVKMDALEKGGKQKATQTAAIANIPRVTSGQNFKVFKDCSDCPEMVSLPTGVFTMGANNGNSSERPVHEVEIVEPFAIGKYEITFEQYAKCVEDEFCQHRPSNEGWGAEDRPVINVSYRDTQVFINWLRDRTGENYRLPTEAEWEYAAKAGSSKPRWWGDNADGACQYANVHDKYSRSSNSISGSYHRCSDGFAKTAAVGSFRPNPFGLSDMIGNVWEWTAGCWHKNFEGAPDDGSKWEDDGDCSKRVLKGGAWAGPPMMSRATSRIPGGARKRRNTIGFRVARTLD